MTFNVDLKAVLPTKTQVGLSAVTNDAQVKRAEMAVSLGVATLGSDGLLLLAQRPPTPTLTPASSAASGVQGQICHDANYFYWRDATRWNRVARDVTAW